MRTLSARFVPTFAPLLLALLVQACGSDGGDGDSFVLQTTDQAGSALQPVEVRGPWMVYFADESFTSRGGGTDLNGDADTNDDVAAVSRLASDTPVLLAVAAKSARVVENEIYLVVDELEDGKDWSVPPNATTTDVVLLHWSETAGVLTFVDTLDLAVNEPIVASETRLYYSAAATLVNPDETTLRYVDSAAPTTPVTVLNTIGAGAVEAHLLGEDDGLVFVSIDEGTPAAPDLNGDLDQADQHVLSLLDGTDPAARIQNVGVALQAADSPIDAFPVATGDWLLAFLVDEAGQGGTNLNATALNPVACLVTPDVDATDEVLHFLDVGGFFAGNDDPVNTGIAGHDRVLALAGHVATLADEADASCDLNQDTDTTDTVVRWCEAVTPAEPVADENLLHAVEETLPGGSMGLSHLSGRLVIAVDGAEDSLDEPTDDIPPQYQDFILVAWLDPTLGSPVWHFEHQDPANPGFGTGIFDSGGDSEPFAGTSWMAKDPVGNRLALTFLEEVPGTNTGVSSLNARKTNCDVEARDADKTDALPVWADFAAGSAGPVLDFDGTGFAVSKTNAGIVIAGNFAFFRVSEADDNDDYNQDGDQTDVILMRNPLTTCGPVAMSVATPFPRPVIDTDGTQGAAFLASETNAGVDFNEDGDTLDVVVRYFTF